MRDLGERSKVVKLLRRMDARLVAQGYLAALPRCTVPVRQTLIKELARYPQQEVADALSKLVDDKDLGSAAAESLAQIKRAMASTQKAA